MRRLLLSVVVVALRLCAIASFQCYRVSHRDLMRRLALVLWYAETRVRIRRDRIGR